MKQGDGFRKGSTHPTGLREQVRFHIARSVLPLLQNWRAWESLSYPARAVVIMQPHKYRTRCLTTWQQQSVEFLNSEPTPSPRQDKVQAMLPRIYSDFNNKDELHRVRLNLSRSKTEIENLREKIASGIHFLLYVEGEFEVEAVLDFDAKYNLWVASPIYSTIVYHDGG